MGRKVLVNQDNVELPDGNLHKTGDVVTLTDAQWAALSSTAVSSGTITDQGAAPDPGATDVVGTQAADVPNVATADATDLASAIALVNALKASHNALLTNLRGADRPMA